MGSSTTFPESIAQKCGSLHTIVLSNGSKTTLRLVFSMDIDLILALYFIILFSFLLHSRTPFMLLNANRVLFYCFFRCLLYPVFAINHAIARHVFTPVLTFWYGVPLSFCSVEINARQMAATREGLLADARHAVAYCHACKPPAFIEGIIANARHTIKDSDARQTVATYGGDIVFKRQIKKQPLSATVSLSVLLLFK